MTINIQSLISLAEFFLRTPKEKAELDFASKGTTAIQDIFALPSVQAALASGEALITAEGWTVGKDPATGHVTTITPPVAPYVAPAHQSPSDFNLHQGE